MASSCGCHELVLLLLKQGAQVDPEVRLLCGVIRASSLLFIIAFLRLWKFSLLLHFLLTATLVEANSCFVDNSFFCQVGHFFLGRTLSLE
jgi:hypothetical protein